MGNKKVEDSWSYQKGNEPDFVKRVLSIFSLRVRQSQFEVFLKLLRPRRSDRLVDIGVSSAEVLPDINFFEKNYPYPECLTAVSIDKPLDFKKKYPKIKFVQIKPGEKLPFVDKSFDIVASWATLEHVGGWKQQTFFLEELFRIGRKVFITTPYRGCLYEPHTGLFFVHWLPEAWFRKICGILGKKFWSSGENLRCLWKTELERMLPERKRTKVVIYKMFGIIPSHLIVVKN